MPINIEAMIVELFDQIYYTITFMTLIVKHSVAKQYEARVFIANETWFSALR